MYKKDFLSVRKLDVFLQEIFRWIFHLFLSHLLFYMDASIPSTYDTTFESLSDEIEFSKIYANTEIKQHRCKHDHKTFT